MYSCCYIAFLFCILTAKSKPLDNDKNITINEFLVPKDFVINFEFVKAICTIMETALTYDGRQSTMNFIWAFENEQDPLLVETKRQIFDCGAQIDGNIFRHDYYDDISTKNDRKRTFTFILIDKFSSFKILQRSLTPQDFNLRGFYLFVMMKGRFKKGEYHQMAQIMYNKKIVRVAFAYENLQNNSVQFDRMSVFQYTNCWSSKPMKVVEFKNGEFPKENFEIFKRNFDDLHGCPVTIPTFHRPPGMIIDEETGRMSGFDVQILQWLSEKLNFRIREMRLNGSNQWGTYDPSTEKMTGALKEVFNGDAHFAIGSYILRSNRSEFFDFSFTYCTTPLLVTIPLGERYTSFEQLIKPFDIVIWSLMLAMFVISIWAIFVIHMKFRRMKDFVYGTRIRSPIINIMVVIFGGSQRRLPKRNFARFMLMMLLIFCLVQRNVYQGLLYIFVTGNQRHPEIKSLNELIEKGFSVYTYPSNAGVSPENKRMYYY